MSSLVNNNFLQLIPTAHRAAILEPSPLEKESVIPALQKTRRSSSTTSADTNSAEEPTAPVAEQTVASPVDEVKLPEFLKLGH